MKIVNRIDAGVQPVYDLTIEGNSNFLLQNGLVAHNCFNKSHSVAYSFITYACAWLKANYPVEFFTSLLSVRSKSLQPQDWAQKAPGFILEAKELGVEILPPYINTSNVSFTIHDNKIYFGLSAIRDVKRAANYIIKARGDRPFKDIHDFITRVNINKVNIKVFTSLVKAGAFDRLGYQRQDLLDNAEAIYNYVRDTQEYFERKATNIQRDKENKTIQTKLEKKEELKKINKRKSDRDLTEEETSFLEETKGLRLHKLFELDENPPKFPEIKRYTKVSISIPEILQEGEYIGCFVTQFPGRVIFKDTRSLSSIQLGETEAVSAIVNTVKLHVDKNGNKMMFLGIADDTAALEAVIFASQFSKLEAKKQVPQPKDIVRIYGKLDKPTSILVRDLIIHRSEENDTAT